MTAVTKTSAVGFAILAACSNAPSSGPVIPPTNVSCTSPAIVNLAVGEGVVLDPAATANCVQIPPSASGTTEHIVVTVATNGNEAANGISSSYSVSGGAATAADIAEAPMPDPVIGGFGKPTSAEAFHARIRAWDRELSKMLGTRVLPAPPRGPVLAPPTVGSSRNFFVCSSTTCSGFVTVTATAKFVGTKSAIYLDNAAPSGGFTQADIDNVGALFENPTYGLHKIDTTAFGAESDLDGNGVVVVLLTPRVNKLSTDCSTSVIAGFFLGLDLVSDPHSNNGEVFYSMVPDPNSTTCNIPTSFATQLLPVTFIHEFQHMISFNQHVLIRGGTSEDTWLNEGLSHFAEELGGRQIDNSECTGNPKSCLSQYVSDNIGNAYNYLLNPEATFLIEPGNSTGTLEERGANWLFVRWFLDQFSVDTVLGTDMTRQLEATNSNGFANVAARSGVSFPTLVTEWQLANFLEGDTQFIQDATTERFRYKTWNLRGIYTNNPQSFPKPYPLTPALITTSVVHSGTLRGGSGLHLRVQRAPGDVAFNFSLQVASATVQPRIGVVRVK
jgi:hypothetical protein